MAYLLPCYYAHCLTDYYRNSLHTKINGLPELGALLKQVNHLLRQANLPGQFPAIVGYYHRELKNLILVSAGLNATLNTGEHQVQISNGVPLGTLGNAYLNQLSQRCDAWQCQIWGTGGRLRLMLSAE
ncbi:orphan two-component response regulator [Escherichia coli]|nr:orphan two-component response regulator [Escherichia coli]